MNSIFTIAMVLKAVDEASSVFKRFSGNAVNDLGKIQAKMKELSQGAKEFGMASTAMGVAMVGAFALPAKFFADFEEEADRMKIAFSTLQGVDKNFDSIKRQTIELGNRLPGTTQDFVLLATAMKEAGIAPDIIERGGLQAAAKLKVLFRENDPKALGQIIAGATHGLNLKGEHLVKFADLVQRAHFGFGVALQDIQYAIPYISRAYGAVNPEGGLKAAQNMTVMMGMLKQAGLGASEIGTAISGFYSHMPSALERLEYMKNGGKSSGGGAWRFKEIEGIFEKYHMKFQFWDPKGNYIGDEMLMKQIWKLKEIGLTMREINILAQGLAGDTGGSAFVRLINQGEAGWRKAEETMRNQADLDAKMKIILESLQNVWKAMIGTMKNVAVVVGGAVAPALKTLFELVNNGASRLQVFLSGQEKSNTVLWQFIRIAMGGLGILGAFLVVLGALAIALGSVFKMGSYAVGGLRDFIKFIQIAIPWINLKTASLLRMSGVSKLTRLEFWKFYYGTLYDLKMWWSWQNMVFTKWLAAQWVNIRATILSTTWLRAQAAAFGTSLTGSVRGATTAMWGWVLALRASAAATIFSMAWWAKLPGLLWVGVVGSIRAVIGALNVLRIAALTNPIGIVLTAIAVAALLIYKFWGPISGFFRGIWRGIKEGLKGLEPAWDVFKKFAWILAPIILPLKLIYNLIKWLIKPIEDTGNAAENLGVRIGRVIGNAVKWFVTLPYRMYQAGANIIKGLWDGIKSVASGPVNAVKSIVQKIRNLLPFSPAKEGPLMDLHRVKILDSVVRNINIGSAPLVNAMKDALTQVSLVTRLNMPRLVPVPAGGLQLTGGGPSVRGGLDGRGISVTIQNVNVYAQPGSSGKPKELAQLMAHETGLEVDRVLRRKYAV